MDWSHVDYLWVIVMFLSAVLSSHSDGTHSLQVTIGEQMLNFTLFWWRNKLTYILDGLRARTFSANFHFWVNYPFKRIVQPKMKILSLITHPHVVPNRKTFVHLRNTNAYTKHICVAQLTQNSIHCLLSVDTLQDVKETNCWIKSLFLFSLHTKSILVTP